MTSIHMSLCAAVEVLQDEDVTWEAAVPVCTFLDMFVPLGHATITDTSHFFWAKVCFVNMDHPSSDKDLSS